jgi:hypothetical protein
MATPGLAPQGQTSPSLGGNGMAIAGMVLGIISLALCWVMIANWVLSLLAIIFSALGIAKAKRVGKGKGMAIAGLVCAILGALIGVALFVFVVKLLGDTRSNAFM